MKDSAPTLYKTDQLASRVTEYCESVSLKIPQPILDYHARIYEEREDSMYMISTFQSQAQVFLARLIGAKRVLEIGVYIGYSAMIWAHAVGPQGKVTGLEYEQKFATDAEKAWKQHGYENIEVHVGDAAETLPKLAESEPYDIIFVDADKTGYPGYLKQILAQSAPGAAHRLLRPGGIIATDNTLRRGLVADNTKDNPWRRDDYGPDQGPVSYDNKAVAALREYNDAAAASERLETFLVPLWDGLNLSRLID
ncbi:S-adenosyl-L-methionine-dependent methyltransferase [Hypoxylon sp. NC1633]|nr:S-adenosyl-L-methionine-dependent methyltransferase [Hypoxylon sp. NC1633]